jgi:hypothetical protein
MALDNVRSKVDSVPVIIVGSIVSIYKKKSSQTGGIIIL